LAFHFITFVRRPRHGSVSCEQAYIDGVKDGLKLGQLVNNVDRYNIAIQQFNDNLNQTFSNNASKMWLPKMATENNAIPDTLNLKPVHKIDGSVQVLKIGEAQVKVHMCSNIECSCIISFWLMAECDMRP
jgi:hypothetical protein